MMHKTYSIKSTKFSPIGQVSERFVVALPNLDLSRAVLIGTSAFENLPNLPAVRNNLTGLSAALSDNRFGILAPDSCVIVDSPETTASFLRRLRAIARQAEDFLLVYYAGHGLRHQTRDLLYLAVQDTDPEAPEGTAVRFDSVREVIEDSPARTRLLILDCCYSGMALGAMSSSTIDPRDVAVGGTTVITSSPKNMISHSPLGERFTAFSGELISLLATGSPIAGEPLTVDSAYRSLRVALARRNLPEPKRKLTDTSGDILLRRPAVPPPSPVRETAWHGPAVAVRPRIESRQPASTGSFHQLSPMPSVSVQSVTPIPVPQLSRRHQDKTANAWRTLVRLMFADSAWWLLWIGLAIGIAFTVGGFSAAIVEASSNPPAAGPDVDGGIGAVIVGMVCGFVVGMRILHLRRKGHRWPTLRELSPAMDKRLSRVRRPLLIVGLVLFAFFAVFGAFQGTGSSSSTADRNGVSSLAVEVSTVCAMLEGAAACGFALYRRRVSSAPPSDPGPSQIVG
jgi:hypothetical protein